MNKLLISSALALLLLTAPAAFADEGKGEAGFHLGVTAGLGHALGLNAETRAHTKIEKDDDDHESSTTRAEFRARMAEKFSHVTAGIVTSINGALFTIDPFGPSSTTTVTTNGSTIFKAKGSATTSSALTVGSRVFLIGTTTATSSTGDAFTASLVQLVGRGFGHMKLWFGFGVHHK